MEKINIAEKLNQIQELWSPHIIGELNDQHIKLARIKGEFIWHKHHEEDEMFYVLSGQMTIEFRDHSVVLNPGEFIIVPRGIEHRPVAKEETTILLFEPSTTINTGNKKNELTRDQLKRI